jgi:toxin ParE1/3/4
MARIELTPEIRDDFDRILDHLSEHAVEDARGRIREIVQAIDVLRHNPLLEDSYPQTLGSWSFDAEPVAT